MRGLLALAPALALAFAGCVDAPSADVDGASLQPGVEAALPCELREATLLEWHAPDPPQSDATTASFDLDPGARDLHVAWTDGTASAGDVEIRLLAPDESVVFERTVGTGVSAAGSHVTVNGVTQSEAGDVAWPTAGEYTFTAKVEGAMPGAALAVTALVCGQ